jgi:hypothetical protein
MKFSYTKLLLLVTIIGSLLFTACKKSSSGPGSPVIATVNGTAYQATATTAIHTTSFQAVWVESYQLTAGDSIYLEIDIPDTALVNKPLVVGNIGVDIEYQDTKAGYKGYYGGYIGSSHGTITLSGRDTTNHKIAGTFNAVLYNNDNDSIKITNGVFNTSYSLQ